jgi:hypothetical protein
MDQVPLDQVNHATFSALVKTRFRVRLNPANQIELELTEARRHQIPAQSKPGGPLRQGECFSLFFNGPLSWFLKQNTYEFEHDQLGKISLFMVPIGKTQDAFQYEVVFNRLA